LIVCSQAVAKSFKPLNFPSVGAAKAAIAKALQLIYDARGFRAPLPDSEAEQHFVGDLLRH
jgi:hypothetical protein